MTNRTYQINELGQLIEVRTTKSLIINPEVVLNVLKKAVNEPTPSVSAASNENQVTCYYGLGDGVSVFQRHVGTSIKTFGAVMLHKLPFYTNWALIKEDNKHLLVPNNGTEPAVTIGAPLMLTIPEDLIVHFVVNWTHQNPTNIMQPLAGDVGDIPTTLMNGVSNCFLTAFSRSRNTCVHLPVPNLYPDAHLCTGSSFDSPYHRKPANHWGVTTSIKTHAKGWSDTGWNNDLLGGPDSPLSQQYRNFVRFNAETGNQLPFSGCEAWEIGTSPVPLMELYRPWLNNKNPKMPQAETVRPAVEPTAETTQGEGEWLAH